MGVVTNSSSTSQTPLGLNERLSTHRSPLQRTSILAFKSHKTNEAALVTTHKSIHSPIDAHNEQKRLKRATKSSKRAKAISADEASPCTLDLYHSEAAPKLKNGYKLSSPMDDSDVEDSYPVVRTRRQGKKIKHGEKATTKKIRKVVRSQKEVKRLGLDDRIALKMTEKEKITLSLGKAIGKVQGAHNVAQLVREYTISTDPVSLDRKKMKIPSNLPSSEQIWLFNLMQPMKVLFQVKENLWKVLNREPTNGEIAAATYMSAIQVRRHIDVGQAARNKLIKHNLRLVVFVINKHFREFANGPRYQDLCQAGVKGLITAIDRFDPKRKFQLSTYGVFWIRQAIVHSMTLSSFTKVPLVFESLRIEILRAKLDLMFELEREPTEEEIIEKVGLSTKRYHDVMRASKPVLSLHSRDSITQDEIINGIRDIDVVGGDEHRQPAILRLALDDVLDSLKPKEILVITQRYGLDGKGDRTLREIAGKLNISREMVRLHEVKALMKLKHPDRVDYLRRCIFQTEL